MSIVAEACPKCGSPIDKDELRGRSYAHCLSCGMLPDHCECSRERGEGLRRAVSSGGDLRAWAAYEYSKRLPQMKWPKIKTAPVVVDASTVRLRWREEIQAIESMYGGVEVREDEGGLALIFTVAARGWWPNPMRTLVRLPALYPEQQPDGLYVERSANTPFGYPIFVSGIWRCMAENVPVAGEHWHLISWHLQRFDPSKWDVYRLASSAPIFFDNVYRLANTPNTASGGQDAR